MVTIEKKKTQVLIVGAGPTGFMMASQLAVISVDFQTASAFGKRP
jgi:cation diffusion facilitator CzcD-associated flavoprotein CzcO